jgi:hypothetical protein
VELDLEELVGFLHLIGFDQPLYRQEGSLHPVVGYRLLVHELIDVQLLVLVLGSVRDVVGNKSLQLLDYWVVVLR